MTFCMTRDYTRAMRVLAVVRRGSFITGITSSSVVSDAGLDAQFIDAHFLESQECSHKLLPLAKGGAVNGNYLTSFSRRSALIARERASECARLVIKYVRARCAISLTSRQPGS